MADDIYMVAISYEPIITAIENPDLAKIETFSSGDESGVIMAGEFGLQGPKGDPGLGALPLAAENKDVALLKGQAVAIHSSGTGIIGANASDNAKNCVGLITADTASAFAGSVQLAGLMELTDWTNVIGSASLAAKSIYYLSGVSGKLTTVAPTSGIVQVVGRSLSTTQMKIEIEEAIVL